MRNNKWDNESAFEPTCTWSTVRASEGASATKIMSPLREYVVKPEDLPIWEIYQCDYDDLAKLCIRQLAAGEMNEQLGYHPPKE